MMPTERAGKRKTMAEAKDTGQQRFASGENRSPRMNRRCPVLALPEPTPLERKPVAQILPAGDDPPDDRSLSALQMLVVRENEKAVQLSLLKIAPYYREVLLLRFHEELPLEEIASVLETPISTVKSRLYRGLEALKSALPVGAA